MMTLPELRTLLEERLNSSKVAQFVNWDFSQVLDFPDGFFVEIVLNDASYLHEAEGVLTELAEEVKQEEVELKGSELDGMVRALWTVREVEYVGSAYGPAGVPKNALGFKVIVESGSRHNDVYVELTRPALDRLREKLGISREEQVPPDRLRDIVREFLTLQLSDGGTSYWDPIRFPKQELTAASMSYLLREKAPQ